MSYNYIALMGNCQNDPEYVELPTGQTVCKFSIKVDDSFVHNKTHNKVTVIFYIDVEVWGYLINNIRSKIVQGTRLIVEGKLKQSKWEDSTGQKRSKHLINADRIVFVDEIEEPEQQPMFTDNKTIMTNKNGEINFQDQLPF